MTLIKEVKRRKGEPRQQWLEGWSLGEDTEAEIARLLPIAAVKNLILSSVLSWLEHQLDEDLFVEFRVVDGVLKIYLGFSEATHPQELEVLVAVSDMIPADPDELWLTGIEDPEEWRVAAETFRELARRCDVHASTSA